MEKESKKPLNRYFDHTLLEPQATSDDIRRLCREAWQWRFYSVCVNPRYVELAAEELRRLREEGLASPLCVTRENAADDRVRVVTVAGFPLGASHMETKAFEARLACERGAEEVDMVLAIGDMKAGRFDEVRRDIEGVVKAVPSATVKVILETCLLTDEEIARACILAEEAGAGFVKTSTGFASAGAFAGHVKLMKQTVGERMGIKASGGIRDLKTALTMIEAGADRIGASASVKIMEEYFLNHGCDVYHVT